MQLSRSVSGVALALFLLLPLAGCDRPPPDHVTIGLINHRPENYEGREIKLAGRVTNITVLPFVKARSYTLRDASGAITVVTDGALPAMNEAVTIEAVVKTAAFLDGQSFGLWLKEIKRL